MQKESSFEHNARMIRFSAILMLLFLNIFKYFTLFQQE